ncbi:PREDICTED: uncharacterized protein LOC109226911 isoform X2 [Nicotiana attenuata]|uniref:uncharacterized protein LOC109226911 isoform X2 n=1 Tax=Nicotiana attenuata TaxID=49451 RepID=UPI000905CA4C|nr:PREDICTED: uncharacterized protein LOC109226911 isoform X2 [Nicotiana attenuata]
MCYILYIYVVLSFHDFTSLSLVKAKRGRSRDLQYYRGRNLALSATKKQKYSSFTINAQQTYTSQVTILADMPLYESPHASFDRYMEDKPRVFKAIFPENRGTQRVNEEEWRIRMEPIAFLFLTAWPVVNMRIRYKTKGKEYPSGVPTNTSTVLELKIIKWDLEGLTEGKNKPSEFRINMEGALYPDRRGARSRIKGHFNMSLSFAPPPMLALVPPHVHQHVTQSVMNNMAESMQHKVRDNLLADYTKFKKENYKNIPPPQ